MIMATASQPRIWIGLLFVNLPITFWLPVRRSSGTSAKGKVKLRTTCERMRIFQRIETGGDDQDRGNER